MKHSMRRWLTVLALGVIPATLLGAKVPQKDQGGLQERVDKRIQAWQPTSAERRLDEIGWADDLKGALRLAKENSRPVFLFSYSGSPLREHAICQQRC